MCFEVILQIIVACFAVFGLCSLFSLIGETWFISDNISVCIEVDTEEVARDLDLYLREAKRVPLSRGGVTVLIRKAYAEELLLRRLCRRKIRHYVVDDMENKAE